VERKGRFTGVIRFRGEHGYTTVRGHRRTGRVTTSHHHHCNPGQLLGAARDAELLAKSGRTIFSAYGDPVLGPPLFIASTGETVGRVSIFRLAIRPARETREFTFDGQLTSAHAEPGGATFSGSADFASPHSWTGSLTASFPGASDVPMAGPDFSATLKPAD
jgi:hypothetical protein